MQRASLHHFQALLDHHRMNSGDHRTGYAERDTDKRYACTVEEDPGEEAQGDNGACDKDHDGGTGVQEEVGGENGEWENHTSSDLVERRVDVGEGVVGETAVIMLAAISLMRERERHLRPTTFKPTIGIRPLHT